MKRILVSIGIAVVMTLVVVLPASAATSQNVTVTATPEFIAIANSPATFTLNSLTGTSKILPSTTYYTNPLGDTTSPTGAGATDSECEFTITNTSNIVTDLTVTMANMSSGDASTNGNSGAAGATSYGAKSYFSGQASGAWVVTKTSGSSVGLASLGATTNIKWGFLYATQTNAWTTGTSMTTTATIAAVAH